MGVGKYRDLLGEVNGLGWQGTVIGGEGRGGRLGEDNSKHWGSGWGDLRGKIMCERDLRERIMGGLGEGVLI